MKKIGLLTTLLIGGLLLTGCSFNLKINDTSSVVDEDKPSIETESGRLFACNEEVGKYFNITTFGGGWDTEEEGGASFILNGEVTYEENGETIVKNVQCVVDMVDKSVTIQEVSYDKDEYPWEPKDLYHAWHLVGFNYELTNVGAELMFTDKHIGAKFCNDMGSDDYSIEGNTIHVRNMVQNLMACDSEELMEYESKFDLSNAKISLVEHSLRITTSNGDVYDFYRNGYESEDDYNQFLEAIKSSGEQPQGKNNLNIPTFEELEDVVATCHVEDMGGYDYDVLKNQYILPYKDGYIGYGFGGNGGAWGYYLKYSSLDNPCEVIATTDEFFIWHADYFHEVEEFNNDEYPDDKLYVAQGGWSGIPIDTVAKELNCEAGKDRMEDDTCKKEVDKYMYNLIIGNEENEVFTKWMNKFKNDIDNGNYTNRSVRNENRNTCNSKNSWESLMEEYGEDNRNLSNEKRREYQKIHENRMHECLENLNLGLIER